MAFFDGSGSTSIYDLFESCISDEEAMEIQEYFAVTYNCQLSKRDAYCYKLFAYPPFSGVCDADFAKLINSSSGKLSSNHLSRSLFTEYVNDMPDELIEAVKTLVPHLL